jgi:hypothetical protein
MFHVSFEPKKEPRPSLNHDDDIHHTIPVNVFPVNWASLLMKEKMIQYRFTSSRMRAL